MWTIAYSKQAIRTLRKMPRNTSGLVENKINELAKDPSAMRNVVAMKGEDSYRLRIGGWRVIYTLDHKQVIVAVVKVKPRGEVYR